MQTVRIIMFRPHESSEVLRNVYMDWNKGKQDILNAYSGTVILIANGGSLNDVPDSFLEKHPTIGTNNIYLKGLTDEEITQYPNIEPGFIPTFYTILGADQLGTKEARSYCRPAIEGAKLAFVNRGHYPHFDLPHVYGIHGIMLSTKGRPEPKWKFSTDIMDFVGNKYTNTYVMLQVVYYLGFTEVLCVGLDNDYEAGEYRHFYPDDPRFSCESSWGNQAHRSGSNYMFGIAKEAFDNDGRKIYNINNNNNTPFEGRMPEW